MEQRNRRKERTGYVVSNRMNKSIVVEVRGREKHPKYGKYINRSTRFIAHDEQNTCDIGDLVRIMETRPLSKQKRWRLMDILEKVK